MSTTEAELKKLTKAQKDAQKAEEAAIAANEQANNDYITGYNNRTQELGTQIKQSNDAINNAAVSYSDMIASWEDAMKKHSAKLQEEAEKKNKQEQEAIKVGGLANVANAIINLIGTAHGASNQPQSDFVSKWQTRADAARREREAKLGSYHDQIKNLEAQRALLQYNFAKERASADANLASLLTQRGDASGQMRAKATSDSTSARARLSAANQSRALQSFNAALQREKATADAINKGKQTQIREKEAEARIQTERSKQLANGYDAITGKFYNPKTRKFDSDSFIATPSKSSKSLSDYNATDWRGFRDKYAKNAGLEGGYQGYVDLKSFKRTDKEKKENYNEWLNAHPEEAQVLEWLASPIDLQKGDLDKLLIMQSVIDVLDDNNDKPKGQGQEEQAQSTKSKPITQDIDGYVHGGYLLGKRPGVTYDENNKVDLP